MTEKPFTTVKRDDLAPICPHCEKALAEVYVKSQGLGLVQAKNNIYFCPHCRKVLGFGQSRMV